MLAHHPLTGSPIRVMKTETHLYKNKKTLAWLHDIPTAIKQPERLSRWDTIVTSWEAAEQWKPVFGSLYPSSIVLTDSSPTAIQWIKTKAPKTKHILFLSKEVMNAYGQDCFSKESFLNVICLEEMAEMYPHTNRTFQQGEHVALTIMTIAALFRVGRVLGISEADLTSSDCCEYANQLKESYGLQVDSTTKEPEQLWLLQQYYVPSNTKRAKELKHCLDVNLKNPFIDKILLLNETDLQSSLPNHPKLQQQIVGHRLEYADIVQTIQTQVPEGTFVAFANSDIYLDYTWRQLWSVELKDVFLSLLRYEEPATTSEPPTLFGSSSSSLGRPDSQDTWVLHSTSVKERVWDLKTLQFEFGRAGCDNAVNVELLRKKFIVANPALSLQTIHCHASGFRTYNPKDILEKPVYLHLEPTGIHDLKPLNDLSPYTKPPLSASSFSRRVQSASQQSLKTLCSMVNRQEKLLLQHDSDNMYIPQINHQIYQFQNAFTTPNGLVYGYDSIYLGKTDSLRKAWASTKISHMTTCIGLKSALAVPLTDQVSTNLFQYLQTYLARIFRMKAQGFEGDFWLPRDTPRLQEFLQFFKWDTQNIPVVPRDKDLVVYAKTTTMLPPQEEFLCEKEDIEALRANLRSYVADPTSARRVVIFQDDSFFSDDDVLAMEAALEEKEYEVTIVYPSRSTPSYILSRTLGCATCITGPKHENLFWLLPQGTCVIEVQSELQIVGEGVHMAGAANLEYWTILLARAKVDIRRKILVEQVLKTVAAAGLAALEKPVDETQQKPLLLLPKGFTGFHGHAGDSFREMASLWFSKGFVELEYTTESPYVWLGGIGQTLLYDRATFQWLEETPATYKQILCGNPGASKVPNGVQWSFWPRRPTLVEQRVEEGLPTYSQRTDTLVFYGKVENSIQERHRNNKLHEACDEFFMPLGVEKVYAFDQETYLNKLASAKFGLCMAGFGPKCNREIECMALGTVPVVAPDVDMDGYAVPPQEGVHYLRLQTYDPEDALALVRSTSQDVWEQLSAAAHAWWKANASSEGLWALTQQLACQLSR